MKSDIDAELPVIEVPPELRGWSDEDIIRNSESSGSKARRLRPSKRERFLKKIAAENEKMSKIAREFGKISVDGEGFRPSPMATRPMPKISDFMQERKLDKPVAKMPVAPSCASTPISSPARPSSGRVLRSSFCGKMGFSFKAEAVPEKRVEVVPVKRGRGRPRKNPLPE